MTDEGRVKAAVKRLLSKYNCYWLMPVMNGMGAPALDFHCIVKGYAFCIETKAGNKQPTPRQEQTILAIQKAGGKAFVVNEVRGLDTLEQWLKEICDA